MKIWLKVLKGFFIYFFKLIIKNIQKHPNTKEEEIIRPVAPASRRKRTTKSPAKSRKSRQVEDDEVDDPNYDEFYDKLNVRVPPSTYDTSDFDKSHLFHIRMSNYLRYELELRYKPSNQFLFYLK